MSSRSFRTDRNASEAGRTLRNGISEKVLGKKEEAKVKEARHEEGPGALTETELFQNTLQQP